MRHSNRRRAGALFFVLAAACAGALLLAFFVGSSGFSFPEFEALLSGSAPPAAANIFFQLRLPRAIGALLVGAALAVSGCALQSVFQNPMADPYVLGVSAGAGLGAALAIAFAGSAQTPFVALLSFSFALITTLVVYSIAQIGGKVTIFSLLLCGFVISALMSALLSLVMILHRDKMEQVVMWNMGSLSAMSWGKLAFLAPMCIAGIVLLQTQSRPLNVLLTGTEAAQSLGVDTQKTMRLVLILCSLLTASAVAAAGIIGFVGLIVPHLLRMAAGPDNRVLMPLCTVGGAVYLLLCDVGARTIVPTRELPVGIITAILGVPFFLYLLRRGRRTRG